MKSKRSSGRVEAEVNGNFDDEELEWMEMDEDSKNNQSQSFGYHLREVDISQIPSHLMTSLTKVQPQEGGVLLPDEVQSEEGAWILQCPKDVKLQSLLKGKKIHLDGRPSVLINEEDDSEETKSEVFSNRKFEAITVGSEVDSGENIFMLLPDTDGQFKMVSAPLNGHIMIREHLEDLEPPVISVPRKKLHKLPSGIKERHPIYGVDLSLSPKKVTTSSKMLSAKKHKDSFSDYTEELSFTKAKQAKKVKRKDSLSSDNYSEVNLVKSTKKSKHQTYNIDLVSDDTEKISSTKSKSKRRNKENFEQEPTPPVYYQEEVLESPTKKKKSKKRKRDEVDEEVEYISESIVASAKAKKPKMSKKAAEIEDEVIIHEYEYEEQPRKSKKSKKSKARELE